LLNEKLSDTNGLKSIKTLKTLKTEILTLQCHQNVNVRHAFVSYAGKCLDIDGIFDYDEYIEMQRKNFNDDISIIQYDPNDYWSFPNTNTYTYNDDTNVNNNDCYLLEDGVEYIQSLVDVFFEHYDKKF